MIRGGTREVSRQKTQFKKREGHVGRLGVENVRRVITCPREKVKYALQGREPLTDWNRAHSSLKRLAYGRGFVKWSLKDTMETVLHVARYHVLGGEQPREGRQS